MSETSSRVGAALGEGAKGQIFSQGGGKSASMELGLTGVVGPWVTREWELGVSGPAGERAFASRCMHTHV